MGGWGGWWYESNLGSGVIKAHSGDHIGIYPGTTSHRPER